MNIKKFSLFILCLFLLNSCSSKVEENIKDNTNKTNKEVSIETDNSKKTTKTEKQKESENTKKTENMENTKNTEVKDCDTEFKELKKKFSNNYDSCFISRKKTPNCEDKKLKENKLNIAIIFDDSTSMNKLVGNEKMIDVAKEELKNYLKNLDSSIGGGVIVYGHKGDSTNAGKKESCNGIELIGEFASGKEKLIEEISNIEPKGWTSIDQALTYADKYLTKISKENDEKLIFLISDGKETCGGNPVKKAEEIASNKNTYIDVVGFNVYGDSQSQLVEIAKAGGGKYFNVKSRADFKRVFSDMQAFSNEVSCGASKASIQLRGAVDTLNTFYNCMYLLREEETKILSNMTKDCSSKIEDLMEERVEKYEEKLEKIKDQADEEINSFENAMEDVLQKF